MTRELVQDKVEVLKDYRTNYRVVDGGRQHKCCVCQKEIADGAPVQARQLKITIPARWRRPEYTKVLFEFRHSRCHQGPARDG